MTKEREPAISKSDAYSLDRLDHKIYNETLSDKYLYHYTTIRSLVAITNNKSIRASPFHNVNDPAESHISNRHSIGGKWQDTQNKELNRKLIQASQIGKKVVDEVRRNAHVLCFSADDFEQCGLIRKGYAIPQMWAHYANGQKGVCIVFRKDKLLEEIKTTSPDFHFRSITYDTAKASGSNIMVYPERIMKIDEAELKAECLKESPNLFWFYKDDGWKYEQESRVVFPEPILDYTYIPIKKSVVSICLGSKFQKQAMLHIQNFKKAFNIEAEKSPTIYWDRGIASPSGIPYKA